MNVYEVWYDSDKDKKFSYRRLVQATCASSAIGQALRRTKHNTAKRVSASCEMIAKNTTLLNYKAAQQAAKADGATAAPSDKPQAAA